LQSSSDNPALYSEKNAMPAFNVETDALTVASDTLTAEARSKHSGNRSESSERYSENSAGCSENSTGYAKNIQQVSYELSMCYSPLLKTVPEKPRQPTLLLNKRLLFLEPEPPVKLKMKQENYTQNMKKMRCILILNPLIRNKNKRLATAMITTKYKRHIEMKRNAAAPGPAASSNYILSIILI
jgi:hypothetical protein